MKNTRKKVAKVTNIDGYDVGHLNMSVQSVQDKTGRVEYILFATLYAKNKTDNIYDENDVIINKEGMSEEDIEKGRMEKFGFQVPLINQNKDFRDKLVQLMEDALKLKVQAREKKNK